MPGRSRISDRFEGLSVKVSICMDDRLMGRNGHDCGEGKDLNEKRRNTHAATVYVPYCQGFLTTAALMRPSSGHVSIVIPTVEVAPQTHDSRWLT